MYQAGGRISINIGGTIYSPRGKATIDAAGLEHDVMANHDKTVSRSTKNKACTAELTFDRGKASNGTQRPKWDQAFMLPFYDVTIREDDVGVIHLFTNASIIGTPKIDTENGEVAGLSIATDVGNYTQTNA